MVGPAVRIQCTPRSSHLSIRSWLGTPEFIRLAKQPTLDEGCFVQKIAMSTADTDKSDLEIEGVVVKLRKASRTLAFLSIRPTGLVLIPVHDDVEDQVAEQQKTDAMTAAVETMPSVQAVLEHESGWRQICGSDGRRICCGAVVSLWGRRERKDTEQTCGRTSPASIDTALSVLVRGGKVQSSPHDSMTAAGGVKQHAVVERAAASAAAGTAHCVKETGKEQQRESIEKKPICRQWWKANVDGVPCACNILESVSGRETRSNAGDSPGMLGVCGRRHYFLDTAEVNKYAVLQTKRERTRELERAEIADDPHTSSSKEKKAKSDGLFVDWLLVSPSLIFAAGLSFPYLCCWSLLPLSSLLLSFPYLCCWSLLPASRTSFAITVS